MLRQFSPGGKSKGAPGSSAAELSLVTNARHFSYTTDLPLGTQMSFPIDPWSSLELVILEESDNLEPHKGRVWAFFHVHLGSSFVSCKCVPFLLSSAIDLGRESLCQAIRGPALFCQGLFTSYNLK